MFHPSRCDTRRPPFLVRLLSDSGPNFVVDDTGTVTAQARQNAIEDATQKAQVLASQLNVHLGRVVGFSENGGNAYPMMDRGVAKATVMSARAPAPSLPVGESETTSNVSVSYEIR